MLNRIILAQFAVAMWVLIFFVRTPNRLELEPTSSLFIALNFWILVVGVIFTYYTYYHIPMFVLGSFLRSLVITYILLLSTAIWILAVAKVLEIDFFYTLPVVLFDWMMNSVQSLFTVLMQDARRASHFFGGVLFACLVGMYFVLIPVFGNANRNSGGYQQGVAILSGLYLAASVGPLIIIAYLLSV